MGQKEGGKERDGSEDGAEAELKRREDKNII
jgi:hypothetical protein